MHRTTPKTKEAKPLEAPLYSTVEGPEYEVIEKDLTGGKFPCPHDQKEFALKECPAYVPTTALGGVGGGGGGVEEEEGGLYDTVLSA